MDENAKDQKARKKIARMGYKVLFGYNLKNARTGANLSRAELAELMSVSTRTIARYENDEEYPPFRMAYTLSKLLCFSLDALSSYDLSEEEEHSSWVRYIKDRNSANKSEFYKALDAVNQYIDSNSSCFDIDSNRAFLLTVLNLLQSSYKKKHNVLGISESHERLIVKLASKIEEIKELFRSTSAEENAISRLNEENRSLHIEKQELQKELDKLRDAKIKELLPNAEVMDKEEASKLFEGFDAFETQLEE